MIVGEWVPRQRFAGALKRCNLSRELPRGYADVLLFEFIWRQRACHRQASSWTCNFWSRNRLFHGSAHPRTTRLTLVSHPSKDDCRSPTEYAMRSARGGGGGYLDI
jgi:hypothetical protein